MRLERGSVFGLVVLVSMFAMMAYSFDFFGTDNEMVNDRQYDAMGMKYTGIKVKGKPEGKGLLEDKVGNLYVGGFKEGRFEGEGILILPDGTIFSGNFKKGEAIGEVSVKVPKNSIVYDGDVKNIELKKKDFEQ